MKFFDDQEIRSIETLTEDQIKYIKQPSLGMLSPFNYLLRRQWKLLIAETVILYIAYTFIYYFEFMAEYKTVKQLLIALSLLVGLSWFEYYSYKNNRRMAWNRNKWKDFASFKRSERCWKIFAILYLVISFTYDNYVMLHNGFGFNFFETLGLTLVILVLIIEIKAFAYMIRTIYLKLHGKPYKPIVLEGGPGF